MSSELAEQNTRGSFLEPFMASLQKFAGAIVLPRVRERKIRPRLNRKIAAFCLLSLLALNLAACDAKDSTPIITNVWGAGVGDPLCPGVTVHALDWVKSDDRFQGINASAIDSEGVIHPLEVGTTVPCGPDVQFWVTGLMNNGKSVVDGLIKDYN